MIDSADEFVMLRTSRDESLYTRAGRDEAPESVWLEVIRRFPAMRQWVAYNKTVPVSVLAILATDSDPEVRMSVADKRKLSPELFELLSHDEDEAVRARIAWNRKTPESIRARLLADPAPLVREGAAHR